MSIRWAEPWDEFAGDEAAAIQGPWAQFDTAQFSISNANPRTGTWHLRLNTGLSTHQMVRRVVGDSLTTVKVGYGFYCDRLPDAEGGGDTSFANRIELLSFRDAANAVQVTFVLGTNGQVVAYRGGGLTFTGGWSLVTLLDRSDPAVLIPARAYSHLEFFAEADNANGAIEVRLNEVTIMNLTGLDTVYSGLVEYSQIAIAKEGVGVNGSTYDFDDIVLSDALGAYNVGFVGDKKAFYRAPDSDGPDSDFAVSTGGTSYSVLDETPPNDADYLSMGPGLTGKTSVGVGNLPANTAAVSAVIAMIRSWKDDAGTCDMKPGILQGATYASGAGQPQTTAPQYYFQVYETDPVSGVPFVPAEVDSLDLVVERSA